MTSKYLLSGHDEEILEINTTERELAERALLLKISGVSLKNIRHLNL